MVKRKRAVVIKAESARALPTVATDVSDGPEHESEEGFEPELPPTEDEESQGFEPEPTRGGKKGKERVVAKSAGSKKKTAPKKKPVASRKDFIKIKNKDGTHITREPQVNSDYVPLPWKGRLGFACLNTYLRTANPPIFCSRTCRIETILKQGSEAAGKAYVESLGLANAQDLVKMIQWNEKYGIKFLRISSEMFPFASHPKYGYSLEFAGGPLKEAGRVAMELGHRLSMHPGQFTQIASPKENVVTASVRDLEYHSQLLSLLGLKGQADRDSVMILHMGGVFGDKKRTIDRFRENYKTLLSDDIKARLVLENDDVNYTVHDILPICKELNIPLVLDYHHHNIRHREDLREGTLDLMPFMDEIKETWTRKNITQKQHYSEARDDAVTDRDMRKHSKRVRNLPPCPDTMDLMIEAKDKEQAVFELYKKYGIGGEGLFNEVIPHTRTDENPPDKPVGKAKKNGGGKGALEVKEEDIAMGGEGRRVYWPEGNEDWLSPAKKARPKKEIKGGEDEEVAANDGAKDVPKKKPTKKQTKKEVKDEEYEEVTENEEAEIVVTEKPIKRQTKKNVSAIPDDELDRTTENPKPSRAKRQKIEVKNEDEEDELSPTITIPASKKKRPAIRKVTKKKAPLPSPSSDSKLSSAPLITDDENEGVLTAQQKEVFRQVDAEAMVRRRSRRTTAA